MHKIFTRPIHIRFAQCDSAGIVFHPQFLTIFNGLIEDFFSDVVGKPFPTILQDGLMIPVAGLQCNFLSPCRAGDRLTASLWIEKLGYSSVRFAMTLSRGNDDCVRLVETMVCVSCRRKRVLSRLLGPRTFGAPCSTTSQEATLNR